MCLICDRIDKNRAKRTETGYVVLGDHQHFWGCTLFLRKRHETELCHLDRPPLYGGRADGFPGGKGTLAAGEARARGRCGGTPWN